MKKLQNIISLKSILSMVFALTFTTGVALASVNNSGVVTVGAQTGSLTAGTAGSVTYSLSTTGNGNGVVTWSVGPLPANVFASFSPTTTPSGNGPWTSTLTLTTNASAAATAGTSFAVTATGDGSLVATSNGNLVIAVPLTPQTIDFPQPADVTYGVADFNVAATSTSGLTVSMLSATTAVCTISGFTVHIVSAGTCTLRANQAGNGVYASAPQVIRSFNVNKKTISITAGDFAAASKVYDGTTNALLNAVPAGVTFSGVVAPDVVTIDGTSATGLLSSRNASSSVNVTFSGYVLGGANANNYNLSAQPASETQTVTPLAITVRPSVAASKVYDGNTSSAGVPTVTVGAIQAGDTANFTQSYVTAIVGVSKNINAAGTVNDGNGGANYNVTFSQRSDAAITAKGLTVTGVTANNKVYDGTDSATSTGVPTLVGLVPSDVSNVVLGGSMFLNFSDQNAGVAKTVTVSGLTITGISSANYTLTQPTLLADITRKSLTVSGLSASNKVYDQNVNAIITGVPVLNGVVSADALPAALSLTGSPTGTFLNKNVGTNKVVNISGLSIIGTSATNYILVAPTSTANITAATLTVTVSGTNKVYDGNTSATVTYSDNRIAGDTFTAAGTANFNNKTVGNSKLVTVTGITLSGLDAANYTLSSTTATTTANITKKDMTVTAVSSGKVYDATVIASTTLSSSDKVSGDLVTYNRTSSNFSDKNVGVAKTVTTGGITISGADAPNYNLLNSTTTSVADITPRFLVVTPTAVSKVYDSNTSAAISALSSNVIAGDTIGTLGSASANFIDKNVGTGKLVTVNVIITPAIDNTNYTIPATATTTANITKRTLTVSATGIDKVYDGNTGANVNFTDNRLAGDTFTIASSSSSFNDKNVGTNKLVTVLGLSLTGLDSGNYNVAPNSATTTANITAKSATITAENKTKVYGTSDPALTATTTGLVAPDTLSGSLTRVAGENVGTYDITAGTISAGSNYSVTFATGTLTITKADQTITITPIADKNPDDAPFNVVATTTSGLPLTYSLGAGVNKCTIVGSLVTLSGATGTCQIVVDQAGDSNYNAATSASVTINIIDTKAPVITINGDATTTIFVGTTYVELGAVAVDFVDGTTTATVSGDVVNTSLAGTYVVRYNATDTSGNVATEKTRTVIVLNNGGLVSGGGSIGGILYSGTVSTNDLIVRNNSTGGAVLGASKFRFTKNLKFGMKNNNDVKELQKVLLSLGFYKGAITGNFDTDTLNAVKAYQAANKIKPASGYFGPLTRAVINK